MPIPGDTEPETFHINDLRMFIQKHVTMNQLTGKSLTGLNILPLYALLICKLFILSACASFSDQTVHEQLLAYTPEQNASYSEHAPVFIVENPKKDLNRIGTPSVTKTTDGSENIFIDTCLPTLFVEKRPFHTFRSSYTNYVYRIHFKEIPFSFAPFYLGAGKNVGLIVIVTLNTSGNPILYTVVHTCGCYLAFIPTSFMPDDAFPHSWPEKRQEIYSENLPAILDLHNNAPEQFTAMILLREDTHRVKDIWAGTLSSVESFSMEAKIQSLESLEQLALENDQTISFYRQSGSGRGYVKESTKIWERIFMGWWALDWRVGEDKKLGRDKNDPPTFYTSLKPWARDESDLRDFETFLAYWGWNL